MTNTTLSNTTLWAVISLMFLVVIAGAVFIAPAFTSTPQAGLVGSFLEKPFDNPNDIANSLQTFGMALGGAVVFGLLVGGFLRWILKRKIEIAIRGAVTFCVFLIMSVTFVALVTQTVQPAAISGVGLIGIGLAAVLAITQYIFPEWYIIDVVAILSAIGLAAFLGSSMGIIPILVLLGLFSVYDFVAVLCSKWMKRLAQGSANLKLPSMFVLPKDLKTSYIDDEIDFSAGKKQFMILGTADFIFPTVLVVAAYLKTANLVLLVDMSIGIVASYTVMFIILKYGPEKYRLLPGIPFLTTGVVLGLVAPSFYYGFSWII